MQISPVPAVSTIPPRPASDRFPSFPEPFVTTPQLGLNGIPRRQQVPNAMVRPGLNGVLMGPHRLPEFGFNGIQVRRNALALSQPELLPTLTPATEPSTLRAVVGSLLRG